MVKYSGNLSASIHQVLTGFVKTIPPSMYQMWGMRGDSTLGHAWRGFAAPRTPLKRGDNPHALWKICGDSKLLRCFSVQLPRYFLGK